VFKPMMQAFTFHVSNPITIRPMLFFLTNVCIHKSVSELVPNHGVVGGVQNLLTHHKASIPIVIQGLNALENIAYGSARVQDHMKAEGVIQTCKDMETVHKGQDDVKRASHAVINALSKMESRPIEILDIERVRDDMKNRNPFPKEEKVDIKQLNRAIKNFLNAGELLMKHSKTAPPRPRHVYVDNELKYLIWKDPKDRVLNPDNKMKVFKIKSVDRGRCTPQLQRKKPWGGKDYAKEECSFAVQGRERTVDLEANSEAQRERWVHALETLVAYTKSIKAVRSNFETN